MASRLPGAKRVDAFVLHRREGLAVELERARIGRSWLTPISELFVCQHHPFPTIDVENWPLQVVGGDGHQVQLDGRQLTQLEPQTCTSILQCSGNGRAFAAHQMMESRVPNWAVGAVGNVCWGGAALSDVLELADARLAGARFVTVRGADPLPQDVPTSESVVERSVPLEDALADGLLVWEVNGEPLPLVHGGPLRFVLPGYFGINNVKWVGSLQLTAKESAARMQRSAYRVRPVGAPAAAHHATMWRMQVKSFPTFAERCRRPGGERVIEVAGVSFAGDHGIADVAISVDGGNRWQPAQFDDHQTRFGWRRWHAAVPDPGGEAVHVASRAVDGQGTQQPEHSPVNERGYGNNGWAAHRLALVEPTGSSPSR